MEARFGNRERVHGCADQFEFGADHPALVVRLFVGEVHGPGAQGVLAPVVDRGKRPRVNVEVRIDVRFEEPALHATRRGEGDGQVSAAGMDQVHGQADVFDPERVVRKSEREIDPCVR